MTKVQLEVEKEPSWAFAWETGEYVPVVRVRYREEDSKRKWNKFLLVVVQGKGQSIGKALSETMQQAERAARKHQAGELS